MSSSISSIGSGNSMMMQSLRQRPDPAKMAEELFSKLDTTGQGYISKTDLQSALDIASASASSSSSSSSSADSLFSQLDADGDGKVTKQEFTDTLKKLAEQLDNQFMSMRMRGGMQAGGMPPPPPPSQGDNKGGFTKDELSQQLSEIGSSDSKRSDLISKIANNFDKADTDGDGKVSFKEAIAFDQSVSSPSASTSTDATASTANTDLDTKLMKQIMKLMQAYSIGGSAQASNNLISTLSVTA